MAVNIVITNMCPMPVKVGFYNAWKDNDKIKSLPGKTGPDNPSTTYSMGSPNERVVAAWTGENVVKNCELFQFEEGHVGDYNVVVAQDGTITIG